MKIKIIENIYRINLESAINDFIKDKKVFNIQYSQTYLGVIYTNNYMCLKSAMIIYE